MCGIFAYTGERPASPILLDGLKTLEYRGYDSAGLYVPGSGPFRAVGHVSNLTNMLPHVLPGTAGIAHTRWATHGAPSVANAHPHHDEHETIWLVHNGIIENYLELREELEAKGYHFLSETDSEVLAHLVGEMFAKLNDLPKAVTSALERVHGTYGIAVMNGAESDAIVAARMGSPIALGIKDGEYFVASDAAPILRHTKDIVYLEDGEYAVVSPKAGYSVFSLAHERRTKEPEQIEWSIEEVKKGGHQHFMLKEMLEIPDTLQNSVRGRLVVEEGRANLGGLSEYVDRIRELDRMVIVGCGSAYYAGLVGKMLIEEYAQLPVEVGLGSEYRYRTPIATRDKTALLAISQSGETADTLASIREAKANGMDTYGIVNVTGSTIARETDAGVYNHAGPEIGVASTKAFVSQLEVLALFALFAGRARGLSRLRARELAEELASLPDKARALLAQHEHIRTLAESYIGYDDFLYVGRRYNLATAYEGALKLKEVSYIHAEGYGAGEMKHGPIAMIDEVFPTVAIMPDDSVYEKMRSNVEEVKARNGKVIAVATEGNDGIAALADDVMYVPDTIEPLTPILATIPLQLFAYYQGILRGFNVDRPRNLAKSVTVE